MMNFIAVAVLQYQFGKALGLYVVGFNVIHLFNFVTKKNIPHATGSAISIKTLPPAGYNVNCSPIM